MFIYVESSQFYLQIPKSMMTLSQSALQVCTLNGTFCPSANGSSKENSLLEKKKL